MEYVDGDRDTDLAAAIFTTTAPVPVIDDPQLLHVAFNAKEHEEVAPGSTFKE